MSEVFNRVKEMFGKTEEPLTAQRAWIETTYGAGSYRPIEKRIVEKQEYIRDIIKGKFSNGTNVGIIHSKAYRCVIDIDEDLKDSAKEIFEPFVNGGFNIINLSDYIDEIKDENVYLISWKNAFDKPEYNNKNINNESILQ